MPEEIGDLFVVGMGDQLRDVISADPSTNVEPMQSAGIYPFLSGCALMVPEAAAASALRPCPISFGPFEQKRFRNLSGSG